MHVEVRAVDGALAEAMRDYIEQRLRMTVVRTGERLGRVTVRLAEHHSPHGQADCGARSVPSASRPVRSCTARLWGRASWPPLTQPASVSGARFTVCRTKDARRPRSDECLRRRCVLANRNYGRRREGAGIANLDANPALTHAGRAMELDAGRIQQESGRVDSKTARGAATRATIPFLPTGVSWPRRGWSARAYAGPLDRGCRHRNSQLPQFAQQVRGTPRRIRRGNLPDQRTGFCADRRSASRCGPQKSVRPGMRSLVTSTNLL